MMCLCRNMPHDIRCGLHSGIPLCCILWFITCWKPLHRHICSGYFQVMWLRGADFDHIPCPICLARGREDGVADCDCWEDDALQGLDALELWPLQEDA